MVDHEANPEYEALAHWAGRVLNGPEYREPAKKVRKTVLNDLALLKREMAEKDYDYIPHEDCMLGPEDLGAEDYRECYKAFKRECDSVGISMRNAWEAIDPETAREGHPWNTPISHQESGKGKATRERSDEFEPDWEVDW